jgi:cyanophycin synthetase
MDVTRIRALRGPNLWTRQTAIEAVVRCEPDELAVAANGPLELRLRELLPEVAPVRSIGDAEAVPLARWLERLTLALQARAGCPVSFARTAAAPDPGVFQIVVEYTEEKVGRRALALA